MLIRSFKGTLLHVICVALLAAISIACSNNNAGNVSVVKNSAGSPPQANSAPAPANSARDSSAPASTDSSSAGHFTPADLAKLKWLEGTWKGTGGDQPFFERFHFENDTTLIIETFQDESLSKVGDTSRFELRNGEFEHDMGVGRAVATSITDNAVQFAPAPSRMAPAGNGAAPPPQAGVGQNQNSFRFERQPDGSWNAMVQWPARNGRPGSTKVYKMEAWPKR